MLSESKDTLTMKILVNANDVTDHMLVLVVNTVEWFMDGPMPTDDFIDRLCKDYLNGEGWDIEDLDTPAVRKIMRHARQAKRDFA